ncbi:MAG TPA: class I SAM-dependent methyltransferase [Steroidobacteraceae bacterium]|jgi:SAM-dependent methyltransferase|nr:class I SAM-dependent methyltransferase [Steroidobacteraceae bacterium]
MIDWRRKLTTARERFHSHGLRGLMSHYADRLYSLTRKKKEDAKWLVHKERVDRLFDHKYDIDTRGITQLAELQISGRNRLHGIAHIASDPDEFSEALASLQIKHEDFVFIDLGSGKGRALLLALHFPFRRIIGVEFALELHRIAQANLIRVAAAGTDVDRIGLVHADATEFELPPEPSVIYLYNPFNDLVMSAVIESVLRSHREHPRPIRIIYANPFLEKLWVERGFVVLKRGNTFSLLCPPVMG